MSFGILKLTNSCIRYAGGPTYPTILAGVACILSYSGWLMPEYANFSSSLSLTRFTSSKKFLKRSSSNYATNEKVQVSISKKMVPKLTISTTWWRIVHLKIRPLQKSLEYSVNCSCRCKSTVSVAIFHPTMSTILLLRWWHIVAFSFHSKFFLAETYLEVFGHFFEFPISVNVSDSWPLHELHLHTSPGPNLVLLNHLDVFHLLTIHDCFLSVTW